jgi:hypothetical protein
VSARVPPPLFMGSGSRGSSQIVRSRSLFCPRRVSAGALPPRGVDAIVERVELALPLLPFMLLREPKLGEEIREPNVAANFAQRALVCAIPLLQHAIPFDWRHRLLGEMVEALGHRSTFEPKRLERPSLLRVRFVSDGAPAAAIHAEEAVIHG